MTNRIRLTLQPTPNNDPGAGILIAPKSWEGATENLQLTVQRNDGQYLQDANENTSPWAGSPCYFSLRNIDLVDDRMHLLVGANLIDPLVNSARTSPIHQIELKDQHGYSTTGSLMIKQAPLPSVAGGTSNRLEQHAVADTPDLPVSVAPEIAPDPIVAEPVAEEPVVAPVGDVDIMPAAVAANPTGSGATSGKSRLIILLVVIALLIAAAVGGWFWWKSKFAGLGTDVAAITEAASDASPAAEAAPSSVDAPSSVNASSPVACDLSRMGDQSDLEFIQQCLQDDPDSARLLSIIQQAKDNNHCSIAQRLYANRSQNGDVVIASAYVKEYDPQFHQPSACFKEPDEATARYWYETILQEDPDNGVAKTRLAELRQ